MTDLNSDLLSLLKACIVYFDALDIVRLSASSKQLQQLCQQQLSEGTHLPVAHQLLRNTIHAGLEHTAHSVSDNPISPRQLQLGPGRPVSRQHSRALDRLLGSVASSRLFAADNPLADETVSILVQHGSSFLSDGSAVMLISAGMRVRFKDVLAAAHKGLPGYVFWLRAQRDYHEDAARAADIPDYAQELVYGTTRHSADFYGPSWLNPDARRPDAVQVPKDLSCKQLTNLLFIAVNAPLCSWPYTTHILEQISRHPTASSIDRQQAAKLVAVAVARDRADGRLLVPERTRLAGLLECSAVQAEALDEVTDLISEFLRSGMMFAAEGWVQTVLKHEQLSSQQRQRSQQRSEEVQGLRANAHITASGVGKLLHLAFDAAVDYSIWFGSGAQACALQRAIESLCKLSGAEQLSAASYLSLMWSALNPTLYAACKLYGTHTYSLQQVCKLPAAKSLEPDQLVSLLQTTLKHGSLGVLKVLVKFLPVGKLSSKDVYYMLLSIVGQPYSRVFADKASGVIGPSAVIDVLSDVPAAKCLGRDIVHKLVGCAVAAGHNPLVDQLMKLAGDAACSPYKNMF